MSFSLDAKQVEVHGPRNKEPSQRYKRKRERRGKKVSCSEEEEKERKKLYFFSEQVSKNRPGPNYRSDRFLRQIEPSTFFRPAPAPPLQRILFSAWLDFFSFFSL